MAFNSIAAGVAIPVAGGGITLNDYGAVIGSRKVGLIKTANNVYDVI
jgi:hypothetical protein